MGWNGVEWTGSWKGVLYVPLFAGFFAFPDDPPRGFIIIIALLLPFLTPSCVFLQSRSRCARPFRAAAP
jgi:hypothetical protein